MCAPDSDGHSVHRTRLELVQSKTLGNPAPVTSFSKSIHFWAALLASRDTVCECCALWVV